MGSEATCTATYRRQSSTGRARLETDHVLFRGDFRVKLAFADLTGVAAKDGVLSLKAPDGMLALTLGTAAEKWAAKIQSPKSRVDKLGVKPDARVSIVGFDDDEFVRELEKAGATVSKGRAAKNSDLIFFGVEIAKDLKRFASLLPSLETNGALWALRRKGVAEASEALTMAAGKAAGLVDVKVARFSETHTAEKFVRPKDKR
jgi:hypothetical protein